MTRRAKCLVLLFALAALLATAAPPALAAPVDPPGPTFISPPSVTVPPRTFKISAVRAAALASRTPQVREARKRYGKLALFPYIGSPGVWFLYWVRPQSLHSGNPVSPVEVIMNGNTGRVIRIWTGPHTTDFLSRGHFGRTMDSPWLWALMCVLFVAPFFDRRRPFRMLHLDLVALLAFGVSHVFYTRGDIFASVPLVYPVLAYLLARMLYLAFRPRRAHEPLIPHAPLKLLVVGLVALVGLRIGINVVNHKVIDVGYVSVVGAHRIMHNLPLYVVSQYHGDTYGPIAYVAYVPFEQIFPWHGRWDSVPAAHAAAITFDLLTMLGLFLLGRRLREGAAGRRLGVALAFAWAACPYTLYPVALNTNDTLIAMLLVYALLAIASPARRGAMVALAGAAKFAPLALAPLFAAGRGERRARSIAISTLVTVAVVGVALAAYWPKGGFSVFWNDTIGFQLNRGDDFSLWALHPGLHWMQVLLEAGAVALALAVAFVPRRRDAWQVAALAAAVLIATELPVKHWFYFYVVWFAPFVLVAAFGRYSTDPRRREPDEIETAAIVRAAQPSLG